MIYESHVWKGKYVYSVYASLGLYKSDVFMTTWQCNMFVDKIWSIYRKNAHLVPRVVDFEYFYVNGTSDNCFNQCK